MGRQREALAALGQAVQLGNRWMYESEKLEAAWLSVASWQAGNAAVLTRLERQAARHNEKEAPASCGAEGEAAFWQEWGHWRPEEELSDAERWRHVASIAAAMAGVALTPAEVADLLWQVEEARESVACGARWDQARFDRADVASLLLEAQHGCELSAADLREALEAGRVPDDLRGEVEAALAEQENAEP